jgi:hypothetical protein
LSEPRMIGRDFPQLWWLSKQDRPAWGGLIGKTRSDPELYRWIQNGWVAETDDAAGFSLTRLGAEAVKNHSQTQAGRDAIEAGRRPIIRPFHGFTLGRRSRAAGIPVVEVGKGGENDGR